MGDEPIIVADMAHGPARIFAAGLATGTALLAIAAFCAVNGRGGLALVVLIAAAIGLGLVYRSLPSTASRLPSRHRTNPLPDRDGFHTGATALIEAARRRRKIPTLLRLDIERVRAISGVQGREAHDLALRHVATLLDNELPRSALVARLEGDRFAALMAFAPGDEARIERIVDRLAVRLVQPIRRDGMEVQASACFGLARDTGQESLETLLRQADMALTASAQGTRGQPWFTPEIERALGDRAAFVSALRTGIERGEIVPHFDPQVDLGNGRLVGFEVLARWHHPERGILPTREFLAIAEETGLICDLSLAVMRQAFAAARDWDPSLKLAINLSATQFQDAWLAQKIIKILTETGFPAHRVEVEITERALLADLPLAQSIVASLKNQGIGLALDDFGTGYSSLAHLRALPFDRIKIDRTYVQAMGEDAERAAIVQAIVQLGDSLNLPTTAEGVTDADLAERLRVLGCVQAQGTLYGEPMALPDIRRLLAERHLLSRAVVTPASGFTSPRLAG
ncbi:bifunctional diguanylate cyclase/phosphodiesterase [uncultured Sphingomonas sp.]|uniref:putative bifunctional diguanylate cyclase/phosphodiesterase n=1 Tax=uncultured Sphingomonas sp. TaxID=158754 RepID=UPI002605E20D|nr:bifunctional diguanylate cyclase/phosphodiesterase [uncultured Sphingomonas sp.]